MAVTYTVSNHFKQQLNLGNIAFAADGFKIILMNTTFVFDPDTHATLSDVTADQLPTGGGYTQDTKALTGVSVTEDDVNNKSTVTWDNVTWTAESGGIPATGAYIIYDDTTADDTVCWCVDFGADYAIAEASSIQIQDIVYSTT